MIRVFVYGTLMYPFLLNLLRIDEHLVSRVPGAIKGNLFEAGGLTAVSLEGNETIPGEILSFKKSPAVLKALDEYESNGTLYNRVKADATSTSETSKTIKCWVYEAGEKLREELQP